MYDRLIYTVKTRFVSNPEKMVNGPYGPCFLADTYSPILGLITRLAHTPFQVSLIYVLSTLNSCVNTVP